MSNRHVAAPGIATPPGFAASGERSVPSPGSEPIRLRNEDLSAIAAAVAREVTERVLELLDSRGEHELADATALADTLGVDREWVYEHADQLGAIRLGDGPRPRLRFEVGRAVARFRELSEARPLVPFRGGRPPPAPRPRRSRGRR